MSVNDTFSFKYVYAETAANYIRDMKNGVDDLMKGNRDSVIIDRIYLAAHSLASEHMIMGFVQTGSLCKMIEHVFYKIKNNQLVFVNALGILLQYAVCAVEKSFTMIRESNKEEDVSSYTQKLEQFLHQNAI